MPKGKVINSARIHTAARLFAENILEAKGKTNGEILMEAGYAPSIKDQPNNIMKTPSFQASLNKFLPMEMIQNRHKELLEQQEDLGVAMQATKLGYQVHGIALKSEQANSPIMIGLSWGSQPEEKEQTIDVSASETAENDKNKE